MSARVQSVDPAEMRGRLIATLTAIVTMSVVALGLVAMVAFNRSVEPELVNRTRLIGTIVRSDIQRGLELGIPIERLEGLDRHLTETMRKFSEVDLISVRTASGITVAEVQSPTGPSFLQRVGLADVAAVGRTSFSLPILAGNELVGTIVIQVSPQFVETRLREVFLDVLVIALVATLLALELALVVSIGSVSKPLERVLHLLGEQGNGRFLHRIRSNGPSGLGRIAARLNDRAEDLTERMAALPPAVRARAAGAAGAQVAEARPTRLRLSDFNDIRLALFFFSLASEIAAAFLPLYSRAAARPEWLSPELAAAAPLLCYLVAVAALSPFGGQLARRFGARRLFLASVPPTAVALVAMGFSDNLAAISAWRAITGLFYAVATIACQEYAIRAAGNGGSARPAGAFVAVIFGGVFCGSALGGVIAGRFGFETAFAVGAAIALLSGALGLMTMSGRAGDPAPDRRDPLHKTGFMRKGGISLLVLLIGIAVPMNASTAIFIWYLTPLMLAAWEYGPSDIARVVMLYYLAVVLFGPVVAQLADTRIGPAALVVLGSAISGLALLSVNLWDGLWAVTTAAAGLGLGHTFIRAPQYALAVRLTAGSPASLGALRLVERLGALIGLAVCALFLPAMGPEPVVTGVGLVVLTGSAAYAILRIAGSWRPVRVDAAP